MVNGVRWKTSLVALTMALLASACGARVTDAQRASLDQGRATNLASGPAEADAASSPSDATGPGTPAAPGASTGAPGAVAGATATRAPTGGNGGATDVGVTGDAITLGTVTTLSGPVPGLFQGASIGAQAFAAYINSQGGVFGRKLKIKVGDDQLDAGQNRAQTEELSHGVFAFLGSFSTYDDAGQPTLERQGIPDIGYGLTDVRRASPVNFSPQPAKSGTFRTGPFLYYAQHFPDAVKAMGTIYGDVPASKGAALDSMAAAQSVGWHYVYQRGYQPTETDFTADVIRMRQAGVKGFYTTSADPKTLARLFNAMKQQNFRPEFIGIGASGYDPVIPAIAGAAAEGVYVDQQLALYAGGDAATVPEVALMNQWVQKVKPGWKPDLYTAFAWASGRMLEQALQTTGPHLTRKGMLASLQKIDQFDGNGLLAPSGPASKRQATCDVFMKIQGGQFVRLDPAKGFLCNGTIFARH